MTSADPRPPRPRDAAATRSDLLRAAKRRFTLLGYERTTSRDIAADAGANVSLINRYFGSKDGLFEAVLRESTDTFTDQTAASGAELAQVIVDGLAPGAWPEYGREHPLLLLLRGFSSDDVTNQLRQRTLEGTARSFAQVLDGALPGEKPSAAATRQAGLLLALVIGVITLRELLPEDILGNPGHLDLARELGQLSQRLSAGAEHEGSPPPA